MSDLKTTRTDASVSDFLASVEHPTRRADGMALAELMGRVTGTKPAMWGTAIIGFGEYHYRYESGREGDWFRAGFSPRKANLALYLMAKGPKYGELLARLGKHRTGVSCLYINKLADVDTGILEELVADSWQAAEATL
jgi:hypothetical protein